MNAITLISGWASGSSSSGPSRSNSRKRSRSISDDVHVGSLASLGGVDSRQSNVTNPDPHKDGLKPPEAELYEQLEARHVLGTGQPAAATDPGSSDPSTSYPTPPPTPPIPLEAAQPAFESQYTTSQPLPVAQMVEKQKPSRASSLEAQRDRHARQLARSHPVRCLTRLYILLRRFLALFGVDLEVPNPFSLSPISASSAPPYLQQKQPILASPVSSTTETVQRVTAPPSYNEAVGLPPKPSPRKRGRWRLPGFRSQRESSVSPIAVEADGGDSSDSSNLSALRSQPGSAASRKKRPRIDSESSVPGSPTLTSRPQTSVAQIALSKRKLLVLDLDETLIHSTSRVGLVGGFSPVTSIGGDSRYNASTSGLKVKVVEVVLDGRSVIYHVYKRPWVDFFLKKVSAWYTVVIFTASMQEYADPVIDWLDQGRTMISSRLFRESCTYINGSYVKDLTIVDPDLARVCLVDNSPISYAKDQANGIPIEGWINDPNDEALLDLLPMLDSLRFTSDVRHILGLRLATTSTIISSNAVKVRRHRPSMASSATAESTADDK